MVSPMNDELATSAHRFLPLSVEVAGVLGPGPLRHVTETGSTNADLVDEARAGNGSGAVLVADHQTAGRGRLDRVWEDNAGSSLLVSLRIPAQQNEAADRVRAVGVASRAAVASLCSSTVLAKWPNDLVVVDGAAPGKLSGLLAEFVDGAMPCVVVGVGINIAPIPSQSGASSVVEAGGPADRDLVLAALLRELAVRVDDPGAVLDELRSTSATLHQRVRVDLPGDRSIEGTATAITDTGALVVVDDANNSHTVDVGDVIHLRPA
ncbi:MAG: BirA family biotin operon repressor/biotin-[acetyl-CoA-carboxylase] ligase [Candidatus Aldehydirespiratoraceae bacterium]|jgi:BirA family biotin operon repressor/biotin-[acetyl-CoA-carboxylase] ligase